MTCESAALLISSACSRVARPSPCRLPLTHCTRAAAAAAAAAAPPLPLQALLGGSGGDADSWYFSYWDAPDAHLPVLQDAAYQAAWGRCIEAAAAAGLFRDKVVMDVGCGLGSLAMMAAKVGE